MAYLDRTQRLSRIAVWAGEMRQEILHRVVNYVDVQKTSNTDAALFRCIYGMDKFEPGLKWSKPRPPAHARARMLQKPMQQ